MVAARTMRIAVASAIAAVGTAASAQMSIAPSVPLGPKEVLVQVSGTGKVVRVADRVALTCYINETAATRAEVNKALETRKGKLMAALKKRGVAESQVRLLPNWKAGMGALAGAIAASATDEDDDVSKQANYVIRLQTLAQAEALSDALAEEGCSGVSEPELTLSNADDLKREAKDLALANARKEADRYAAALGLSVVRVVRISDADIMTAMLGPQYSQLMKSAAGMIGNTDADAKPGEIAIEVGVSADYVLGPKA